MPPNTESNTETTGTRHRQTATWKLARVCEALRGLIETLPAGAALPPVLALQQQFQVSQHLIDRAVHALRAEGLLSSRRGSGIYVTERAKTASVGVLSNFNLFSRESGFFGLLASAFHQCAPAHAMRIRHYFYHELSGEPSNISDLEDDIRGGRVDALLGLGIGAIYVKVFNLPFICTDSPEGQVLVDSTLLMRYAVEELTARGCRRLALLHQSPELYGGRLAARDRACFLQQISGTGAFTRPEWMAGFAQAGIWGYREFQQLWHGHAEKPDGLVSMDDGATRGALIAAEKLGIAVPGDLLIASHANSLDMEPSTERVIRIECDTMEIANAMLDRLAVVMAGQTPESAVAPIAPRVVGGPASYRLTSTACTLV